MDMEREFSRLPIWGEDNLFQDSHFFTEEVTKEHRGQT